MKVGTYILSYLLWLPFKRTLYKKNQCYHFDLPDQNDNRFCRSQ